MFAEFKHTLRKLRGQIIGWSIGLGLYALMMARLFDSIAEIEGFSELMQSYPEDLMAMVGATDMASITTPKGFLDIYYFGYMAIIIGIFAVGMGAGLLVGDEEKGILDLVLSYPVSRVKLFLGRLLGFVTATGMVMILSWLSWVLSSMGTGLDLTLIEFLRPFIPLFGVLLFLGTFTTLLSLFLPSTRIAGMLSGGLLIANFLLIGLSNINENLEAFVKITPLYYYQAGDAIDNINWEWFVGLLAVTAVFSILALWRFQRREIRVGGERGWGLSSLGLKLRRRQRKEV
ncbi:MAG: ABC transporter permease subunit [Anaerolineales bacterium]|nr:ABC transporter permease subunit [Anaerolineales bacterium]